MSDFREFSAEISKRIAELEAENENLRLRLDNVFREGKVTNVDPTTGKAEVDMNGLPSDKMPWASRAGAIKEWSPVTVGERVLVANPSGEPGLGIILAGGFSDANPQNHNQGGEHKLTVGGSTILVTGSKIVFTVGGTSIELSGGGVKATAADYEFN